MRAYWLGCILLAAGAAAPAQEGRDLEKRVADFTLANGMRFVVLERHQAPVVSFHINVMAGSVNDPSGQTGLAFLLGRMAFKGTESLGSRNWAEEKKALEAQDEACERMEAERNKGQRMNPERYETLRSQWRLAVDVAARLADTAEYTRILQENGVSAVRGGANWNSLQVGYTLPSNRLELWFALESQRLQHPVLREFEKERDAAVEEQTRTLTAGQAAGEARLIEALLATAFTAHPYRVPNRGWPGDLAELKRSDARAFLEKYSVPGNTIAALVGDVDPAEARRLAEKYFGPLPARPLPPLPRTAEPPQLGPRTVQLDLAVPAMAAIGYKRPSYFDKDDAVLDVIQAILSHGNGGLAVRELVQEKKTVSNLQVRSTYPDGYYPNLFVIFAAPAPGQGVEQLLRSVDDLLGRLRTQRVGLDVLNEAKAQTQAREYQVLVSSPALAEMLALHTAAFGDWRKLFSLVTDVEKVTGDDVLRVAQKYLVPGNRTTVFTAIPGMPARAARTGGAE